MGTPRKFAQYGKAGMWMSDAVPNFHTIADDLCVVRSMHTSQFNHAPAELLLFTGFERQGRPSLGFLGDLRARYREREPARLRRHDLERHPAERGTGLLGQRLRSLGLPRVQCRSKGDPVLFVSDPAGMSRDLRRKTLDALRELNEKQNAEFAHPETVTRIAQYELAYRMQTAVPE